MKRVLFTFLLLGLSHLLSAQTDKGRWLVGAQVGRLTYRSPSEVKAISAGLSYDIRRDTKTYLDIRLPPGTYSYPTESFDFTIGFQLLFGN